ncbi:MAG: hypothetical protein ACOCTT_02145, partial [archaeon]
MARKIEKEKIKKRLEKKGFRKSKIERKLQKAKKRLKGSREEVDKKTGLKKKYKDILEKRRDEVMRKRILSKFKLNKGLKKGKLKGKKVRFQHPLTGKEKEWIRRNWGGKIKNGKIVRVEELPEKEMEERKKKMEKDLELLKQSQPISKGRVEEISGPFRHPKTVEEIKKLAQGKEKVKINDIGYGADLVTEKKEKIKTYQPWEIIDKVEEAGAKPEYTGYTIQPERAKRTQKKAEKEKEGSKKEAKFGGMDIVSSTPAQKSDITVSLNTLMYVKEGSRKDLAIKNIKDSTKKGGHIIVDKEL